jgi:hypothetical protein
MEDALSQVVVYGQAQRFNLVPGPNYKNEGTIQLWNRSNRTVYYLFEKFESPEVVAFGIVPHVTMLASGRTAKLAVKVWIENGEGGRIRSEAPAGLEGRDLEIYGTVRIYGRDVSGEASRGELGPSDPHVSWPIFMNWFLTLPDEEEEEENHLEYFVRQYARE